MLAQILQNIYWLNTEKQVTKYHRITGVLLEKSEISPSPYVNINSKSHYLKCIICGYVTTIKENHTPIYSHSANTHTTKCSKCGYIIFQNTNAMSYSSQGSSGHIKYCGYCDYQTSLLAHRYKINALTGRKTCRDCGYSTGGTTKSVYGG